MTSTPNKPFAIQAGFPPEFFIIAPEIKLGQTECASQGDFLKLKSGVLLTPAVMDRWRVGVAGNWTGVDPMHDGLKGPTLRCSQLIYK